MNIKSIEKKKQKYNTLKLKDFDGINIGDLLYCVLDNDGGLVRGLKHLVCIFLKIACRTTYAYDLHGNGNTLALYSSWTRGRQDRFNAFSKCTDFITNRLSFKTTKSRWSFYGLRYIYKIFSWNRELKRIEKNYAQRMCCLRMLFQVYVAYRYVLLIEQKLHIASNYLITYSDFLPQDSYFTQMFNKENKTTVTLQHGTYGKNFWGYVGSKSDYMLVNSRMSYDDHKESGATSEAIIVGSPLLSGLGKINITDNYHADIFGICLDGGSMIDNNRLEIQVVQEYCKQHNKKLVLKNHPGDKNSYSDIIDPDIVLNVYMDQYPIEAFFDEIDIAITSFSSTFIDALAYNKPSLIFCGYNQDVNEYRHIDDIKFSTPKELDVIVGNILSGNFSQRMKELNRYFSIMREILW